jgi:hypothetical protein
MSKTKVIIFLIAVLVIALFAHMLISCRRNYLEGFDMGSMTGGATATTGTATGTTTGTTTTGTTSGTTTGTTSGTTTGATTATTTSGATPTQTTLGTSPTVTSPSLLDSTKIPPTNGLTATPSAVTAPTTTTTSSTADTSTAPTTATTTTQSFKNLEGFGNNFNASYSSPYWNNSSNMNFFANTKFKPECCKNSQYSNSSGCACMSNSQQGYLQKRGKNNNSNKPFYFF